MALISAQSSFGTSLRKSVLSVSMDDLHKRGQTRSYRASTAY